MQNIENSGVKCNMFTSRLDCFIIWGHGARHIDEIIKIIRDSDGVRIIHIDKYTTKNIRKFVKAVYSYDYAPIIHLKPKIKYLEKTPCQIYIILVENHDPKEDYFGEGKFRHIESLVIKRIKNKIREKFNPRNLKGQISEDHVVHATDNESQTDAILKLIGHRAGVKKFINKNKIILTPEYINEPDIFSIKKISFDKLLCRNADSKDGKYFIKVTPLIDSVQYVSLSNIQIYEQYLKNYLGTVLKKDYDVERFQKMKNNFKYLHGAYSEKFIVTTQYNDDKYIILDGLHRAALHLHMGHRHIEACVYG